MLIIVKFVASAVRQAVLRSLIFVCGLEKTILSFTCIFLFYKIGIGIELGM